MKSVAKSKLAGKPQGADHCDAKGLVAFKVDGGVDVEATRSLRSPRRRRIAYVAPGKDQYWRAMNVVSIHWHLVAPRYGAPEVLAEFWRVSSIMPGQMEKPSQAKQP